MAFRPAASRRKPPPWRNKVTESLETQMKVYDWNKAAPDAITERYKRTTAQSKNMSVARLEVRKGASTRLHRHE